MSPTLYDGSQKAKAILWRFDVFPRIIWPAIAWLCALSPYRWWRKMSLGSNLKSLFISFSSPLYWYALLFLLFTFYPQHLFSFNVIWASISSCFCNSSTVSKLIDLHFESSSLEILPFKYSEVDIRVMFDTWLLSVVSYLEKERDSSEVEYTSMVIKCCCAGTAHQVAAPRCGARTAPGVPPGGAAGPRAQVRSRGRCGAGPEAGAGSGQERCGWEAPLELTSQERGLCNKRNAAASSFAALDVAECRHSRAVLLVWRGSLGENSIPRQSLYRWGRHICHNHNARERDSYSWCGISLFVRPDLPFNFSDHNKICGKKQNLFFVCMVLSFPWLKYSQLCSLRCLSNWSRPRCR